MLVIESIIEKIKELAQKVVVWLNRDKKTADALLEVIKKKDAVLKEGNDGKTKAEDIAAAGEKFGAWLAVGGTIENYTTILKSALTNRVALFVNPKEGTNNKPSDYVENTRDALDKMIRSSKVIAELGGDKEGTYGVSVVGKTIKALVISVSEKSDDLKVSLETITVPEEEYKTKIETELADIPSLETIKAFATTASELAGSLKSKAELSFKVLDDFKKELKSSKEEDVNFAYKKKAATISGQIVLADLNAYTATQKTMIWFASKFVNNYQGSDEKK